MGDNKESSRDIAELRGAIPDLTGGLSSEEYIRRLWSGDDEAKLERLRKDLETLRDRCLAYPGSENPIGPAYEAGKMAAYKDIALLVQRILNGTHEWPDVAWPPKQLCSECGGYGFIGSVLCRNCHGSGVVDKSEG